jgi:hypothetical protein
MLSLFLWSGNCGDRVHEICKAKGMKSALLMKGVILSLQNIRFVITAIQTSSTS